MAEAPHLVNMAAVYLGRRCEGSLVQQPLAVPVRSLSGPCPPWQHIMQTNRTEPAHESTLNAFVQLIVRLNLIFHWVADLFIVGNVQRKTDAAHPSESVRLSVTKQRAT